MGTSWPHLIVRWTDRDQRRALADRIARTALDRRDLASRIVDAQRWAELVRFVTIEGTFDGTWAELWSDDLTVLLSEIATFNLSSAEEIIARSRTEALESTDRLACDVLVRRGIEALAQVLAQVDSWRDRAKLHIRTSLGLELVRTLSGCTPGSIALALAEGIGTSDALVEDLAPRSWRRWERRRVIRVFALLGMVLDSWRAPLTSVSAAAGAWIEPSFEGVPHAPALAVNLTFAQMLGTVQGQVNRLPSALADYYVSNVLGFQPRPATMDKVWLTLAGPPDDAAPIVSIPKGARFGAGPGPDGAPITLAADHAVDVLPVHIVRLDRQLCPVPNAVDDPGEFTGLRISHLQIDKDAPLGPGKPGLSCFAERSHETPLWADAELGLIIAHPDLSLTSGARQINITLVYQEDAGWLRLMPPGAVPADALAALADKAFFIEVSTATGWVPVPAAAASAGVQPLPAAGALRLSLTLAPSFPPLAAAPGFAEPALRLSLRSVSITVAGAAVSPIAVFAALPLTSVDLDLQVMALPGAILQTPDGLHLGSGPIAIFGSPAVAGAVLDIDIPALGVLRPDELTLSLDWLALPKNPRGFTDHYAQYVVGPERQITWGLFDNRSFRLDISGAGPGWSLAPRGQEDNFLFRTGDPLAGPDAYGPLTPKSSYRLKTLDAATSAAQIPSLQVTLTAPAYGFGDAIYVPNITHAADPDAKWPKPPSPARSFGQSVLDTLGMPLRAFSQLEQRISDPLASLALKQPNAPWRPAVSGIQIDFSLHRSLSPGDQSLLHVLPLDPPAPVQVLEGRTMRLIASSFPMGRMDLVIESGSSGGQLDLFVALEPDTASESCVWRCDGGISLIADGTAGLTHSGPVTISIPPASSGRLSASIQGLPPSTRLISATANAVPASRIDNGCGVVEPLPAGSIKTAAQLLPGLAGVEQPLRSSGARSADDPASLRTWTAERLRHKDRAVHPYDYARLALDLFPEVGSCAVLTADGTPERPAHSVTLVVAPAHAPSTDPQPRLEAVTRAAISAALVSRASPFLDLRVENRIYLPVKVKVSVLFEQDGSGSPSLLSRDLDLALTPRDGMLGLQNGAGEAELYRAVFDAVERLPYVAAVGTLELDFGVDPSTLAWATPTFDGPHTVLEME